MKNSMDTLVHCFIIYGFIGFYEFATTGGFGTDNFALMSGTLRTFQEHACDGDELRIRCFPGTVISINLAVYGRMSEQSGLCQPNLPRLSSAGKTNTTTCLASNALKVIEGKCQGQEICRLLTSHQLFHEDPCPGTRKYAEVVYKCRPAEFNNRIACDGDSIALSCTERNHRILIYSANYGSSYDGVQECPQTIRQNKEICQASYATETAINRCQGRQQCAISANAQTFGNPGCSSSIPKYLKVVFQCVPKEVLKEIPSPEDIIDSSKETIRVHTTSYPAWASGMDKTMPSYLESNFQNPNNNIKLEMQQDDISAKYVNSSQLGDRKLVELAAKWISAHKYMAGNTQKLIVYLTASLGVGLILFILVVALHVYITKNSKDKSEKEVEPVTNCADDFFSDSDLEHFEGIESPDENNTMRKISDAIPRAPVTSQASNHYFS